ncbi:MAG: hypothetical protein FP831_09980 [Anaerolineae bacterium]|nr:hypothetical protein [Anaerolineae bacterium]
MLNEHLIAKGYRPISYKKLKHEIDRIPKYQQTYRREGAIAAYVHKPPFICFEYTTPRQGERSFQYGYIDYTEGDIELVSSRIGVNLGKPNYCFLLDGTDKRLLAKYITFNHPNYYSDSMLIRDCVRRHHRLPSTIITDKGSNFESNHFAHLMASFQITKIDRPPREPRGGSPLERIFGTTNTEVFYNLLGNTQNSKNPRQLTPEINPKNLAVWNLPALDACLERWMSLYNDTPHPSLHGQSPNQAYLEHLHLEGIREHTYINYDLPFYFLTLPYVSRDNGLRILHENGYVRVNNLSYYCDEVAFSAFINKKVSVKFDPTNSAVVYVQLGNEWVEFYSDEFHSLKNRSIKEIEIASSELRQLDKLFNQNKSITARRIGEFLDETADQEFLLYQQLQDFDNMQINHKINADFHLLDTGICSADVEITDPGYSKQADSTEVQDNSGVLPHIEILPDY